MYKAHEDIDHRETDQPGLVGERCVSRRDFLKLAGIAGATIGVGAGLGGVLAGCGQEETTTTTAGGTATTAPGTTTTTAAASTTTVSAGAELGREIKIGFVTPLTGAIASFAVSDEYSVERWKEIVGDGMVLGDGKKHPIKFVMRDTQSDPNRSSQVAGDLILNDKVDMILAASTPDTVNPAADQAEALGTPFISCDAPMDSYFFGRGGKVDTGFKWTYHFFWAGFQIVPTFLDIWAKIPTSKVVGVMFPNDPDGLAWADLWPPLFEQGGYTVVDPGRYQDGTEDYTQMISLFKKEGVEIVTGVVIPPDFVNFSKQSAQQGLVPKIVTGGKAMLFPQTAEAIGKPGYGVTCEQWWGPTFPFKSSLTGETCQALADDFEKRKNLQWTQPLMHFALFEVAADVLKRATDVDDKENILAALKTTKMTDSVAGPMDWTAPVKDGTAHPNPNGVTTPVVGGQWVPGAKHAFDIKIVVNTTAPNIAIEADMKPLEAFITN